MRRSIPPERAGLAQAVAAVGGQPSLARLLSTPERQFRQGHVWDWIHKSPNGPPPEVCPAIEAHSGVRCEVLRPDLRWHRDIDNRVIAYAVPLEPVETGKATALEPAA